MFAKLLKYEWKSSWRIQSILSLAALGIGVLGAIILRILSVFGEDIINDESMSILILFLIMLVFALFFLWMALVIYVTAVQFLHLFRFYKSKFTDEGYLTFTLPANSHQIFLSSLVNMLLWLLISLMTVLVALFIAAAFGPVKNGFINTDFFLALQELDDYFLSIYEDSFTIPTLIFFLVSLVSQPVIAMTCITIGAVVAKKHKILAAFGIYYALTTVLSLLYSVLMFVAMLATIPHGPETLLGIIYLLQALLQLGIAVGGYFLSVYLMQNKLNLP